jgi:hypothetical protein
MATSLTFSQRGNGAGVVGGLNWLADVELFSGDLEAVVRGLPTGISLNEDFTSCSCALHEAVKCNQQEGDACELLRHGTLSFIKPLYLREPQTHCVADEATRRNDLLIGRLMLGRDKVHTGHLGGVKKLVRRYCKAYPTSLENWGAGYCYMALIPKQARTRVGRLLGPNCYVTDVVRAVRIVGLEPGFLHLEKLSSGFHITVAPSVGSGRGKTTFAVLSVLIRYIDTVNPGVKMC